MSVDWKAIAVVVATFVTALDPITNHISNIVNNTSQISGKFSDSLEFERIKRLCSAIETVGRSKADLIVDVDNYAHHPSPKGLTKIQKSLDDVHHGLSWLTGLIKNTDISDRNLSLQVAIQGEKATQLISDAVEYFPISVNDNDLRYLREIGVTVRKLQDAGIKTMSEIQRHIDKI